MIRWNNVKKSIESKKWLSFNENSDIFYLDFKELGDIIRENWDDFKSYFEDQSAILTKIEEIAAVRNLIAHNSYIGSLERTMLKLYYEMILKQIGKL